MAREVVTLAGGLGFTEGPVLLPSGEFAVTSISRGCVFAVDRRGGSRLLADLGGGANGATLGRNGELFIAQNGGRWARNGPKWPPTSVGGVQFIKADTGHGWLTREPIAPNDLCFGPDGMLYVTDPTRSQAINDARIWRVDPDTGESELLLTVPFFANGIAFDAEDRLYLASTNEARIYRCDLSDTSLTTPEPVIQLTTGKPDGMAFAASGLLVVAAINHGGQGTIQTWDVAGTLVDTFFPGEGSLFTNIAFDGEGGLVIAASDRGEVLWVPSWGDPGLALHPLRR